MELFGTAGIRGDVQTTVSPEVALRVGRAAAVTAADEEAEPPTVVLGHDGRTTSQGLVAAVEAGLESGGAAVRHVGMVPTPTLAYASQGRRGIMITASHNPPTDNGIKLFVDGTEYNEAAETRIEQAYETRPEPKQWADWGQRRDLEILEEYRHAVSDYVMTHVGQLDGLRVVVDCGNGMAGRATPQVIQELGGDPVALNANIDGHFPARESKPTPESLTETRQFIADADVDIGIGHDGDADRMVVIGPDGEIIHEDTILAIISEQYVRWSEHADPVVITTPNASGRIDERVTAAGGRIKRTALGTLHEGMAEVSDTSDTSVVFAGEPWKHIHPEFGGWIDGVVSAALISALTAAAGGIHSLTAPVQERPYRKVSIHCPEDAKGKAMAQLKERLPEQYPDAAIDTEYGLRLDFQSGDWILIRPSGTEPYLRVYAESETVETFLDPFQEAVKAAIDRSTAGELGEATGS